MGPIVPVSPIVGCIIKCDPWTLTVILLYCCTALVCDNKESQLQEARRRCIVDFDMFHHLVSLCFSLPALYADDESTDEQLLVATGGLNDLHALQLVFTAHVVQLLLTAHVNLKSQGLSSSLFCLTHL